MKHPFELCAMDPKEYDDYAGEISRQRQMIEMINEVTRNEDALREQAMVKLGMATLVARFEDKYPKLTGNEVLQILHQRITWPEDCHPGPMGVKTDSVLLTTLHARTF